MRTQTRTQTTKPQRKAESTATSMRETMQLLLMDKQMQKIGRLAMILLLVEHTNRLRAPVGQLLLI